MKICFLCQNLYSLGGIQRVVTTLINELVKDKDYSITVVMPFTLKGNRLFEIADGIELYNEELVLKDNKNIFTRVIFALNKRTGLIDYKIFNKFVHKYRFTDEDKENYINYINKNRFDVVIGVGMFYSLLVGAIKNKINSKTVGWQHSTFSSYFEKKNHSLSGLCSYAKEVIPVLDKVLVLTNSDKKIFDGRLNINSDVLYNPTPVVEHRLSSLDNKRLIFVGRLVSSHKGLDYLAEIMHKIAQKRPEWKLIVAGEGPDKDNFKKDIKARGIDNRVELVGRTDKIYQYYEKADILLQTSKYEGFGMTITEAMSCGVPSVAFHNFGPDEIIRDGIDGYLVDKFDTDKFVEKTIELIDSYELRAKFSKACIQRAEDFSVDRILKQFKNILNGL